MKKQTNKKESIVKNIFINNLYQILTMIVPLITTPYISRVLQPTGVGIYSYTKSYVSYFLLIAVLGTTTYGTREIARLRDDKVRLTSTFWEIEILTVFTTIIAFFGWIFVSVFYYEYSTYFWAWSFYLISSLFDISWLFAGVEKFKYTISINAIIKIVSCVFVFVLVKSKDDVLNYILISSISMLVGNISMWFFLPKVITKSKPNFKMLFFHFRQTLIYFIPTIATTIYTVLDKTMIGLITQNADYNGFYESATKIINLCKTVGFMAIVGVVTSRSSYLFAQHDDEKIRKTINVTFEITLFISVAISFGIIGISGIFVPVFFGEGYEMTIQMMNILAPLISIIAVSNITSGLYYTPSGHRLQCALYLGIGSFINLICNFVLISTIGALGACISTVISESVISILCLSYCKIFHWIDFLRASWKKIVSGLIMLSWIYFFNSFVDVNDWFRLGIDIFSGAILYMLILFLLRDGSVRLFYAFLKGRKDDNIVEDKINKKNS